MSATPTPHTPEAELHDFHPAFYDVGECMVCNGDEYDDKHTLPPHLQALLAQAKAEVLDRVEEMAASSFVTIETSMGTETHHEIMPKADLKGIIGRLRSGKGEPHEV